jgi:hypothetical protein
MTRPGLAWLGAIAFSTALAAFVTWPQALHMSTALFSHHDPYFSIWRLAWIAHALITAPRQLFDANIFYPASGTLAYSDATLLEGLIAAPFFWLHVSPVLIYNILLLTGFVGSGVAMFTLARYLTGATAPALVAAAIFTMAPYRIEHVMHLELQWAMFVPLTLWALHRAVDDRSWRFGVLAGLCFWLQLLSCVYYGVFLAMILVAFVPLLLALTGRRATGAFPGLAIGAVVAVVLTLPYLWPYVEAARTLGGRDLAEIARYSARPVNYLSATSLSVLWGWTADQWGGREVRLFPGAVAVALTLFSAFNRSWRWTALYAVAAALAIELSFGTNGIIYRWLTDHVTALRGFRSASRFAMLAMCALAMLAGLGAQAILQRGLVPPRWRVAVVPLILGLMAADYANRAMPLSREDLGIAPIYKVIRSGGPGVLMELPVATPDRLPGWDVQYAFWSISHWHPLVNGYSGYHPVDYLQTLMSMRTFPDDASIARLKAHDVRYIIVHRAYYEPEPYTQLMLRIAVRPELRSWGTYKDPVGNAELFVLEPQSR